MNFNQNQSWKPPANMTLISKTEEVVRKPSMTNTQGSILSCGRSKVGQGQIIGGKFITRGAFPW